MREIARTERGWAGHFIAADQCRFRRNTLLECGNVRIVVSTVGNYVHEYKPETIAINRHYETMAFHAKRDGVYWDADVERQVYFDSDWQVDKLSNTSDRKANDMHETVVAEIMRRLADGENFEKKP